MLVALALAVALVLGFAGLASVACGPHTTRTTATPPNPTDARKVANDGIQALTETLASSQDTTYTAEYATAAGTSVTVVQAPPRRAYRGMDVTYVLNPDDAYLCRSTRCQRAPGADTVSPAQAVAIGAAFRGEFIAPEAAIARLAAVASEADPAHPVRAVRGQRVFATGPADCVAVSGAAGRVETACVSPAGVLVFFDGTSESGGAVRIELRRFSATAAPDALDPPAGAHVTDVTALT